MFVLEQQLEVNLLQVPMYFLVMLQVGIIPPEPQMYSWEARRDGVIPQVRTIFLSEGERVTQMKLDLETYLLEDVQAGVKQAQINFILTIHLQIGKMR